MNSPNTRPPLAVYVLAAAIFAQGTSEFMIAGLLPGLTRDLGVSVPRAGMLITAFALGMMIGAPVMTVLTLRLPRKFTLLVAAGGYVIMHLVGVLMHGYAGLMITRIVAAVLYATFWSASAVVATRLAGPRLLARSLALLVGGLSVANVIGVPAGTWLGERYGWRAAFVAVAIATAISAVAIAVLVPDTDTRSSVRLGALIRNEVGVFRSGRLWLALLTTALFQGGVFAAFSYFAPLLINVTQITVGRVPIYLLLFGVGALAGTSLGGRFADRGPLANVIISLVATLLASGLLLATSASPIGVGIAMILYALAAFSIAGGLNARVMGFAGSAPTLAAAVNTSAFNVGNAVGPWFGGLAITAGLGFRSPIGAGMIMLGLSLLVAIASVIIERRQVPKPIPVAAGSREPATCDA
ncbi:chloramphenicol efflux pump [Microlunatus endophyticus]|uniref:Chloramphenicol efflux pump n=1 Tax=Microlunatus endophyticus TaxID=1716077 RepID=A0A917SGZ7_9ACTN|nr:MFS transporter [Microlunatus endophyticus]GGL81392.1 chloramphenicol efflux pump [Microlunatus endophyticus]